MYSYHQPNSRPDSEIGLVLPQTVDVVRRRARGELEELPFWAARAIADLVDRLAGLDQRIRKYDTHLSQLARQDERCRRLMQIPGLGSITATALLGPIGNGHDFKNSQQLAALPGLTPGQHSSGGKSKLGGITKAGDRYLRTLLILGARSVLTMAGMTTDQWSRWAVSLHSRAGYGKMVIAIDAKNARMDWAMLAMNRSFVRLGAAA